METCVRLAKYGNAFATRANGARIANNIKENVLKLQDADTLVIDLSGVEAISYSFTDELIKVLLSAAEEQNEKINKSIILSGCKNEIAEVFECILSRRDCHVFTMANKFTRSTN
jgi:hypothetical protein